MKTETMVITPTMATQWLTLNTGNRPVRPGTVWKYAEDMKSGRWKLNGETIKVSDKRLIDGQHRLLACVKAGVPFVSLVVTSLNDDVFDTVDRGMVRSLGQILHMAGKKNAYVIASAARWLWTLESGYTFQTSGDVSVGELEELIERYTGIDHAAARSTTLNMAKKLLLPGLLVALIVVFDQSDSVLSDMFFEDLDKGLNRLQPVAKLRQRLIADRLAVKHRVDREEMLVITIKAWNAARNGKEIGVLRWIKTADKVEQRPLVE